MTEDEARPVVLGGRFWSSGSVAYWVEVEGERIGVAVIDDLDDLAEGGNPMFDLRLAEVHRGQGLGVPVLRALTDLVFERWPDVTRFEGYTRDDNLAMRATFRGAGWVKEAFHREAWPVTGASRKIGGRLHDRPRRLGLGPRTTILWDDL